MEAAVSKLGKAVLLKELDLAIKMKHFDHEAAAFVTALIIEGDL